MLKLFVFGDERRVHAIIVEKWDHRRLAQLCGQLFVRELFADRYVKADDVQRVVDQRQLDRLVQQRGRVQRRRDVHLQQPWFHVAVEEHVEAEQLEGVVPENVYKTSVFGSI